MMNGPELWNRLIAQISKAFDCHAVVAGGAVRDYLLGVEPKDIDVFVDARSLREIHGFVLLREEQAIDYGHAFEREISGVLEGYAHGYDVQIIARPMPDFRGATLMPRFDIGLCRCWFDGEVHTTADFRQDLASHTLTILRADNDHMLEQARRRAKRIRDRSVDRSWTIVERVAA